MGCGGSSGSEKKIKMQTTQLPEIDEFFESAQAVVDSIYEIKDPIDDTRDDYLDSTELDEVTGGNTHHATVGLVIAIGAVGGGGNPMDLVAITPAHPFISIDGSSAGGKLKTSCDNLEAYIKALNDGAQKCPELAEKAGDLAKKSSEMPDKAKEAAGNAEGLGMMEK